MEKSGARAARAREIAGKGGGVTGARQSRRDWR
jgi:hypothetical protein